MARGDSRLWRKLGLTGNLINVWSEDFPDLNINDSNIKSITINRGSGTVGLQDHTIEINTSTNRGLITGSPMHCDITQHGLNRLNTLTGAVSSIKPRFYGRCGRQKIDDYGGNDGSQWKTSFWGSKWQSQLANSDRVGNQISGQSVLYLMNHFLNRSDGTDPTFKWMPKPVFASPSIDYGIMVNDYDLGEAKIPYSDFAGKYLSDPGYYVQNTRAGMDRVMTLEYRWNLALERLETWLPLTRSQVLSPTAWGQPNEDFARNHATTWRESDGLKTSMVGPDINDVRISVVEHDLSYIEYSNNWQPRHLGYLSYGAERIDSGWRMESVDIDLLHLIDSPSIAHHRQANQLLSMEMGDPIFLSGDWYPALTGIHYAVGITEKITPDEWTISLDLEPSIAAVGEWTQPVPARTWESAAFPWDEATWAWDKY